MDPFTERILERARERQRKLLEYNTSENINIKSLSEPTINDNRSTLLKEPDNTKSHSTSIISATKASNCATFIPVENENNASNVNKINRTFITSSTNVNENKSDSIDPTLKSSASEGNFTKLYRQNSKLNISSEIPGSPQLKTLNIQKENFNMEIKLCSMENVRIEVELQEEDDSNDEETHKQQKVRVEKYEIGDNACSNEPAIREDAKRRLQRLGKLYAGGEDADISSPIHRTEPTFSTENDSPKSTTKERNRNDEEKEADKQLSKSNSKGLGGLAALAENINKWEDNLSKTKPIIATDNKKSKINKEIDRSSPQLPVKGSVLAKKAMIFESIASPVKSATSNKDPALLSVSERKALFEKNTGTAPVPKAPISMPTPIFKEKFKSKTDLNLASPTKENKIPTPKDILNLTSKKDVVKESTDKKLEDIEIDTADTAVGLKNPAPKLISQTGGIASKMAALFQNKTTISQQQIENDIREQRQKEMDLLLNRFHKNKEIIHNQIKDVFTAHHSDSENEEVSETTAMIPKKEVPQIIVKKPQGIPPPPPLPGNKKRSAGRRRSSDSSTVSAVLDDVKRIKVRGTKPGMLYPNLSDIEGTTTETETEQNTASPTPNNSSIEDDSYNSDINESDTSFGRDVLETVSKNTSQKRMYEENIASDLSDILDDMDDYLDEAMVHASPNKNGPTPPKQSRSISSENSESESANSFQYKNCSPKKCDSETNNYSTPSKVVFSRRRSSELPAYVVDGDDVLPLKHTVSFYRKQQTQGSVTPVRQIVRQPAIEECSESFISSSSEEENDEYMRIQSLMGDITRQETIISQASRALNLCYATPEFTGSTEQVEAEKLLLLATHRRAAAQNEIERLNAAKSIHPERLEKGSVTISGVILPLKRDYVKALNAAGGKGHHVVCLIKCAEQVYITQLVSTIATNDRNPNLELVIPGKIHLNDIHSNQTIRFEVYCLQAQEQMLPHEVKYHINNKKSHNKSTPKKGKTAESCLVRPPRESPGGPQAVRTSTFALMGYIAFLIQGSNRKNWTLKNTPSMSPLEGIVEMKIKCELAITIEHHGFLTMFDDVSGFGAWHRRWCLLKGHMLSYWKYPEEEKKTTPIGSVDLTNCIMQEIGVVHRDICARLNTILIETTRSAKPHDKDSLVMKCKGNKTIIRHLLSADTKEERMEWCNMFNRALNVVKIERKSN